MCVNIVLQTNFIPKENM